jgi:carboxypeptidase T
MIRCKRPEKAFNGIHLALPILIIIFTVASKSYAQLPEVYTRYSDAVDILADLEGSYPEVCHLDTMGYSTRDHIPMLRFKISDNVGLEEDEPAVYYCGGVHADEVLAVEVVMNFIADIMDRYGNGDPEVLGYIDDLEIYCVPFINPEGHIVVEEGDTDWRKNKCDNDHNGIFDFHDGVDNNRNYDFGWYIDNGPEATTPESLMYKGEAPFTQTENIAMAEFAWRYRPLIALDYHSPDYGRPNVAYYPWYWYPSDGGHGFGPDEDLMHSICQSFTSLIEAIPDDSGTGSYTARRALVNKGDYKTYYYGNFGTAAFSVEVSDTTIQDPALVDSIVAAHLPGQYYLLQRALGPGITGVIRDSVTLEPLEAEVQVLQHINEDINPRLSRPDYGRYRRLLAPGTYTLRYTKEDYVTKTIYNVEVTGGGPTEVDVLLVPENIPPVPTLSEWGLIIMLLATLAVGSASLVRNRRMTILRSQKQE